MIIRPYIRQFRNHALSVLAGCILILLAALQVQAAQFYVDSSRINNGDGTEASPWKNIGDLNWIIISNLLLSENVTIYFSSRDEWITNSSLNINATGNSNFHLTLDGQARFNLVDSGSANWQRENNSEQRAKITPQGLHGGQVYLYNEQSHITLRGFYLNRPTWGGVNIGNANPTQNMHYITVENFIIDSPVNNHGIWFGYAENGCHDITVRNNLIMNTKSEGIYMGHYNYFGNSITGVLIEGNILIDCGLVGEGDIDIKPACYGTVIRNNKHYRTFPSLTGGNCGVVVAADNCQIDGNEFFFSTQRGSGWGSGIFLNADGDATTGQSIMSALIYNNLLYGNDRAGITITATKGGYANVSGVKIYNNVIWSNGTCGIQATAWSGSYVVIEDMRNNIMGSNADYDVFFDGSASILSADNNLYFRPLGLSWRYGGSQRTWEQWHALGFDIHGVNKDPMFVGYEQGRFDNDFRLADGSPAIDRGARLELFNSDKNGTTRPQGGAWDIGAYEFLSGGAVLHVTSPNGGEAWRQGQQRAITWTAQGVSETLTIEILQGETVLGTVATGVNAASGSYSWTVGRLANGQFVTGQNLKIRIRTVDGAVSASMDI